MIRALDDTFTNWCLDRSLEAHRRAIDSLPCDASRYAMLADGTDTLDRLDAALSQKVQINAR